MRTQQAIYSNMQAPDTSRYKAGSADQSALEKDANDRQIRHLLSELIAYSSDLIIRVWLDGVYTNAEDTYPKVGWMEGREVYFKVEGKVPGARELGPRSGGGS